MNLESKHVVPISSGKPVLPGDPVRLSGRVTRPISLERLFISGAAGAVFRLDDVEVDGKGILPEPLPGFLFGSNPVFGVNWLERGASAGTDLVLVVRYVGKNPEGAPFFGAFVGGNPIDPPPQVVLNTSGPVRRVTLRATIQGTTFKPNRMHVDNGIAWVVHGIRIDGKTQFSQPGSLPGDLFGTTSIDTFMNFDCCPVGGVIEVDVECVQDEPQVFVGRLDGEIGKLATGLDITEWLEQG